MQNKFNIIVSIFIIALCHLLQSNGLLSNNKSPPRSKAFYMLEPPGGEVTYFFRDYKLKSSNESIKIGFTLTRPTFFVNDLTLVRISNIDNEIILEVKIELGRLHIRNREFGLKALQYKSPELLKTDTYYEVEYYVDGSNGIAKFDNKVVANDTSYEQLHLSKDKFFIKLGKDKYDHTFNGTISKLIFNDEDLLDLGKVDLFSVYQNGYVKHVISELCDDKDCSTGSGSGSEEPDESLNVSAISKTAEYYRFENPGGIVIYTFSGYTPKSANESIKIGFTWTKQDDYSHSSILAQIYNENTFDYLQISIRLSRWIRIEHYKLFRTKFDQYDFGQKFKFNTYYELEYYTDGYHAMVKIDNKVVANFTSVPKVCKNNFNIILGNFGLWDDFVGTISKLVVNDEDLLDSRKGDLFSVIQRGYVKRVISEACDDRDCFTDSGSGSGGSDEGKDMLPRTALIYQFGPAGGIVNFEILYYEPTSANESIKIGFTWAGLTFPDNLTLAWMYNWNSSDFLAVHIVRGKLDLQRGRLRTSSIYLQYENEEQLKVDTYYELEYCTDGYRGIVKLNDKIVANYTSVQQLPICKDEFKVELGNDYHPFIGTITKLVINDKHLTNSTNYVDTVFTINLSGDVKYAFGESCDDQSCLTGWTFGLREPVKSTDISTRTTESPPNTSPTKDMDTFFTTEPQYSKNTTDSFHYTTTEGYIHPVNISKTDFLPVVTSTYDEVSLSLSKTVFLTIGFLIVTAVMVLVIIKYRSKVMYMLLRDSVNNVRVNTLHSRLK